MAVKGLFTVESATELISSGVVAIVAGTEELLAQLPAGNWIGGTMRYFMTPERSGESTDRVLVTELPVTPADITIRSYDAHELALIVTDAPANGFSIVIIPAGSQAHLEYAERAPYYPGIFRTPIAGWISGVSLEELGSVTPLTFDGRTGRREANQAIVLHAALPAQQSAQISIANPFRGGDGDVITFPSDGLVVTDCEINGEPRNLARYLTASGADTRLPLVADYAGAAVNASFQSIDPAAGVVNLYAPVFNGIAYRLAAPLGDYAAAFRQAVGESHEDAAFACNCILNYVYGELEGRSIGHATGPMTFGEIAYQLLNQTLVCLTIVDA
jgi:hypothetical protein